MSNVIGRTKQSFKEKDSSKEEIDQKPSTSCNQSQTKFQTHDNIRKLEYISEISFDSNKNYAKNVNNIINGTKVSKNLMLEEHRDIRKVQKSWKSHIRNGMVYKSKRQKSLWAKKDIKIGNANTKYTNDIEMRNLNSPSESVKLNSFYDEKSEIREANDITIENIAERIKKRKINTDKKNSVRLTSSDLETIVKRNTRKRPCRKEEIEYEMTDDVPVPVSMQNRSRTKFTRSALSKSKQRRVCSTKQSSIESSEKGDASIKLNCQINNYSGLKRTTTRKIKHANSSIDVTYENVDNADNCNLSESCVEMQEYISENNNHTTETSTIAEKNILSDEEIIKEQERMERLVIQEKEDFELAQRLQAKFDEMEGIAGRTRRSRRAIESETIELDLYKIDAGRNVQKAMNSHTAKSSSIVINHAVNTEAKKRGRPPKRVK